MRSLLDTDVATEIKFRLAKLTPASERQWGTMTVNQMLAHCADLFRDLLGDRDTPVQFPPEVLERVRRVILADEPFRENLNAIRPLRQTDGSGTAPTTFENDRNILLAYIDRLLATTDDYPFRDHPAAGVVSRNEIGELQYKHLDHHLRQFGV